jgi:hypothetical protein
VEVAVAGGGTDALEGDVERTDILENGVLETGVLETGDPGTEAPAPPAEPDDIPPVQPEARALREPSQEAEQVSPDEDRTDPRATPVPTASAEIAPPQPDRVERDDRTVASKLFTLLTAVAALAGLVVLSVAIGRELMAANGSDDIGDLGYSYVCDKVSGSDPGVYGVGNCRASGGMQSSGLIPVGQAYVLTPRAGNALGYTQSFSCSGGRADSPSMVVPKRCAAIGNPVLASR